jgi:antirestriction protein ArdC
MGVVIVHATQDRAYYRSDLDRIHLPMREQFPDQHGYDATKAHELAHATGQSSRLDRDSLKTYAQMESRAAEEVTAEIGAYLTSLHLGIPYMGDSPDMTEEQHAAYVASWGKNLTRDERRLAVDNGLKAAVYLEKQLELARQQGLLQEQDIERSTVGPAKNDPAVSDTLETAPEMMKSTQSSPERENTDDGLEIGF